MSFYTDAQVALQQHFETRPLAETLEAVTVVEELADRHIDLISTSDFFFLSTVTTSGEPTVSYKGGGVGLVTVVDAKTLAFPMYDGNGMFLSMGNIADTAKVGMLFIDFETPNRVRVQATATLHHDDELLAKYPGAISIVRASIDQAFVNCARYIHKHTRVETSPYVPDENGEQPHAKWKRIDRLQPAMSPADQARSEAAGLITQDEYADALGSGES